MAELAIRTAPKKPRPRGHVGSTPTFASMKLNLAYYCYDRNSNDKLSVYYTGVKIVGVDPKSCEIVDAQKPGIEVGILGSVIWSECKSVRTHTWVLILPNKYYLLRQTDNGFKVDHDNSYPRLTIEIRDAIASQME